MSNTNHQNYQPLDGTSGMPRVNILIIDNQGTPNDAATAEKSLTVITHFSQAMNL